VQHFNDLDLWLQKAATLLESNRISIDGYSYTGPSLDTSDFGRKDYANQFSWDSCFHAIIWRWIDPQKAQEELLSLASRQVEDGPDAGMIPHCNYWRNEGAWLWSQPHRSSLTHPPLLAVAAQRVFEHSQDLEFLAQIMRKWRDIMIGSTAGGTRIMMDWYVSFTPGKLEAMPRHAGIAF
jgi:glycogen debranching enzyme